jgi:Flp pilus assembly protein TadG
MTDQIKSPVELNQGSGCMIRMKQFLRDRRGIAAMEFALVVPILFSLYFMLNETASGMRASRKVTMVSRVMADLSSRASDLTDAMRNDIFSAAVPIMSPYPTTGAGFRITSIRFDATGTGFVDWSEANGSGLPAHARCSATVAITGRSVISVPDGLKIPNTSLILAEAQVKYTPVIGWNITGPIMMADKLFMRPRLSDFVTRNGVAQTMCT